MCLLSWLLVVSAFGSLCAECEVGGLQAVAGLRAQAHPHTFLPHELRQHELRFGVKLAEPQRQPSPQRAPISGAQSFNRTLEEQMRATQQFDAAHHLSSSPQHASRSFMHTHPPPRNASPVPHSAAVARRVLGGIPAKSRVGAAMLKAHQSLAADGFGPAAQPAETAQAGHAHTIHSSPAPPLPAASNIDPALAYLQQLRRREILERSPPANTGGRH